MKIWKCIVCGEEFESEEAPEVCPACGAGKDQFIEVKREEIKFKQNKKEKYVIVGNGISGYYAADSIRKRNSEAEINIISNDKVLTYYRPQLSDYLNKDILDKNFFVAPEDWYDKNNINVTLGVKVESINKDKKTVTLNNGKELSYDKLILATGASNFIPPLKGFENKGVYVLRDIEDAENIKKEMKNAKNAVIVGGGLLGLEAAWEMKNAGLNVSVVELAPRLLPLQLDEEASPLFEQIVAENGITVYTNDAAEEILGEGSVTGLKLKTGKIIDADLILFSVGIRPNKSLAEKAGISVNRGILVNEKMETNIKDIYACGDSAELNGKIYGNWPAAIEMGKIAGSNAVGEEIIFKDFVNSTVFNAINTELFTAGDIYPNEGNIKTLCSANKENKIYKKLFFKDNKLVGAILLNDTKQSVKIMKAIQNAMTINDVIKDINY